MSEENLIADFDAMMDYICIQLCQSRFYCEKFGHGKRCKKLEFRRKLVEYVGERRLRRDFNNKFVPDDITISEEGICTDYELFSGDLENTESEQRWKNYHMGRQEISLNECTRQNLCCDCDNEKCLFHGKKEADCPKYRCESLDCEKCDFLNEYIEEMREYYKGKGGIFNEYELW